jgi:hypothetical protein
MLTNLKKKKLSLINIHIPLRLTTDVSLNPVQGKVYNIM